MILGSDFYARPTLDVARDLIGMRPGRAFVDELRAVRVQDKLSVRPQVEKIARHGKATCSNHRKCQTIELVPQQC